MSIRKPLRALISSPTSVAISIHGPNSSVFRSVTHSFTDSDSQAQLRLAAKGFELQVDRSRSLRVLRNLLKAVIVRIVLYLVVDNCICSLFECNWRRMS